MKPRLICLIFLFLTLFSCQENEEPKGVEETFWVYSYSIPITQGSPPSNPNLIISRGEEFNFDRSTWELIPLEIEGFIFKPTIFQKLLVSKLEDPKTSKIKRKLIQVLSEEKDYFENLEGSWKVRKFLGRDLPNDDFPDGQSVGLFGLPRMAVSSDGCNQVNLEINKIAQNRILSVGNMNMTLILCYPEDAKIAPFPGFGYNFRREGNILTFYSDTEGEIAVWEKMN